MNIESLGKNDILKIKVSNPERIFFGSEVDVKKTYRKLSIMWHPDKNDGDTSSVFAHIHELYQEALKKIKNGTFGTNTNVIDIKTIDGRKFVFRYLKQTKFEMGEYYIANSHVMWRFNKEYMDDVLLGMRNLEKIKYANNDMEKTFERYVPKMSEALKTEDSLYIILKKEKGFLNVRDVLEHYNGKIDPKHVAWIISTALNLTCLVHYNNIMHGGINLDNYYINPETHEGMILGGWWYSKPSGDKLRMLSADALDIAPVSLLNNKQALLLLDLEMIKQFGRQILGNKNGIHLLKDSSIPEYLVKWFRDGCSGTAIETYAEWNKVVLPKSFGKRTFVQMNLKSTDLYREV